MSQWKTCWVLPSGDESGVTDADNIERAMEIVRDYGGGGVVKLLGGWWHPVRYWTSRNVVVEKFNGHLRGGSWGTTEWHAGRKSATEGFAPNYDSVWADLYPGGVQGNVSASTVLELPDAVGEVSISGIAFVVDEAHPTDPRPVYWCASNPDDDGDGWPDDCGVDTRMWTIIEAIGGHQGPYHMTIRDVEVFGGPGLWYGVHAMPWDISDGLPSEGYPPQPTESSLTVYGVYIEGMTGVGIITMDFSGDDGLSIHDTTMADVWGGVQVYRYTAPVEIVDNDITTTGGYALESWVVDSDATFAGNTVSSRLDFWGPSSGWDIYDNTFGQSEESIRFLWGASGNSVGDNTYPDGASFCDEFVLVESEGNDIAGWDDECAL